MLLNNLGALCFMTDDLNATEDYDYVLLNSFSFTNNKGLIGGAIFSNNQEKIELCCNCDEISDLIVLGKEPSLENEILVKCDGSFEGNVHTEGGYGDDLATTAKTHFAIPDVFNEAIKNFPSDTYLEVIF